MWLCAVISNFLPCEWITQGMMNCLRFLMKAVYKLGSLLVAVLLQLRFNQNAMIVSVSWALLYFLLSLLVAGKYS
jgi:hypothetical protein